MQITIEMIESKEFKIKPRGYDQQEVDEFLDAICDEMAAQQDQIQALQQQLMSAQAKRPAPAPAPAPAVTPDATGALQEILEMAQKVKAETIAAAEKQAEEEQKRAMSQWWISALAAFAVIAIIITFIVIAKFTRMMKMK